MKKTVVYSLLTVLILSGTHAFAQFKLPVYTSKNLKNLDRVIANARIQSKIVVEVPGYVVPGGKIGLTKVNIPRDFTSITASLITYYKNPAFPIDIWGKALSVPSKGKQQLKPENKIGKGFYTDAAELAADLNFFYGGKAPTMQGKDGRKVKFYTLPVDGILYQPDNYVRPFVLKSDEFFVIYDMNSQAGQIMENNPSVYDYYKPVEWIRDSGQTDVAPKAQNESAQPMGTLSWRKNEQAAAAAAAQTQPSRVFVEETLENYSTYSQAVAQLRQTGEAEQWWQQAGLDKQYGTGNLLGQAVVRFHNLHQADLPALLEVKQIATGKKGDIYELPVEGLKIQLKNGNTVSVNPQEVVLFHSQDRMFMLVKRSQLTDGKSFELLLP